MGLGSLEREQEETQAVHRDETRAPFARNGRGSSREARTLLWMSRMPEIPGWVQVAAVVVSVVMFVGTLVGVPWLLVRLPADHFERPPRPRSLAVHLGRNLLGAVIIAIGVAMLVLPGQGVLTILVGVSILDVPLKRRVVRRLLARPALERAVQRLRERAGKPPLQIPRPSAPPPAPRGER